MIEMITIAMADYAVARSPEKLTTLGLGSCIGITLYDPLAKIGGMIHIMLPSINKGRSKENTAKFADTGIKLLVEEMIKKGAELERLEAKVAGGAHMFSFCDKRLTIGKRNVEAAKRILEEMEIPIVAQDTGKDYGRTLTLNIENGSLTVKSALKGNKVI